MRSTNRHTCRSNGMSARRVFQTWLMAFVILLAGVTQSGLIPALLSNSAQAAPFGPGSNVLQICTPNGIKTVATSGAIPVGDVDPYGTGHGGQMAGHGFCSLCATHHGAVISLDLPYVAPVSIAHVVAYATANGIASGHEIPRIRHSRAPPAFV